MIRNFSKAFFLAVLLLSSPKVFSFSSVNVEPGEISYHYLETLHAHGLNLSMIEAQRPYTRDEIARQVIEARRNWEKKKADSLVMWEKTQNWIDQVLLLMEEEYADEIAIREGSRKPAQFHPLDRVFVGSVATNARARPFVVSNGGGAFTATGFPFFENRAGRHFAHGVQGSLETESWANLTSFASVYLRPRAAVMESPYSEATLQEGYGVLNVYNVELKVGRSQILWGQTQQGGLLLSSNARPLDHFQLGNENPFIFPTFLKYLGYNKISFFVADLGPEASFPHTLLAGYKWTIKPLKWWELGLANVMEFGGEGGPGMNVGHFFADLAGFGSSGGADAANKILGFDSRFTLPFLRGTQIYGEWLIDDKTTASVKRTLSQTSAYLGGIFIPRITDSGRVQARVEFRYLGAVIYRHFQFLSGHTLNGKILGDALGPDGRNVKVTVGWDASPKTHFETQWAYEFADSNTYDLKGVASTVLANNPAERRVRGLVTAKHEFNPVLTLAATGGYEHVTNFAYLAGDNRNEALLDLKLTVNFEKWLKK